MLGALLIILLFFVVMGEKQTKFRWLDKYCPGLVRNGVGDRSVFISSNNETILIFSESTTQPTSAPVRGIQRGDRWEGTGIFFYCHNGPQNDETSETLKNHEERDQTLILLQKSDASPDMYTNQGKFNFTGVKEVGVTQQNQPILEFRLQSQAKLQKYKKAIAQIEANERQKKLESKEVDIQGLMAMANISVPTNQHKATPITKSRPIGKGNHRNPPQIRNNLANQKKTATAAFSFSADSTPIRPNLDVTWLQYVS